MLLPYVIKYRYWQGWMKMMYDEENRKEELQIEDESTPLTNEVAENNETTTQAMTLPAQRQHIAAIIFMFIKTIKELIVAFGLGLFFALREAIHYVFYVGGAFFLIVLVISILSWLRFTYRVEDNELRVESGILIRKKKYVPINRIHTIDYTANIIHRLFGLVKVKIDTASGGGSELDLSAITRKNGDALRTALGKNSEQTKSPHISEEEEATTSVELTKKKITWQRLVIAGSTTNGIGATLFAAYLGGSQLLEFIPETMYDSTIKWFSTAGIIVIILFGILTLAILYIVGIAGTMIKYAFFTIEKHPDHLFIKRGLIETKELTIPYERIQSITLKQNLLRQLFGFTTIHATVVGNILEGADSAQPILFPLLKEKEVKAFIEQYVPQYIVEEEVWTGVAKKAWIYYVGLPMILPLIATGIMLYFAASYVWIPLILLLIIFLLGLFSYKVAGFKLTKSKIMFRKRFINKETRIMLRNRIQAMEKSQHKLQQLQQISSVQLTVFGGLVGETFRGAHYEDEQINRIGDWYSRRTDMERDVRYFPGNNEDTF